jgi:hypothetical protein
MSKIRSGILASTLCWALVAAASAATQPGLAGPSRPTPVAKPTAAARATAPVVPATLPTLTAQQIAERNAAARGGLAAWQKVSTMTLAGKLDAGKTRKDGGTVAASVSKQERLKAKATLRKALAEGKLAVDSQQEANAQSVIQLPFQMDLKRPRSTRLEVPVQGQTAVQVYDGTSGWKLRPYLGRHEVEPFTDEELKLAASQQELDGPLINYQAKGTKVEVEGGELLEGRGAYRLKLTLKNGDVQRLWIDAQNFLDVKSEGAPRRWGGKLHAVATWFRDYRSVDGLLIAHRLETRLEGVPQANNIYIEKVALNPPLEATRFTKPM